MVNIKNKKSILIMSVIVLALLLTGGWFTLSVQKEHTKITNQATKDMVKTTSEQPSAQENYSSTESDDNKSLPGNTLGENRGSATVQDNGGSGSTQTANPIVSTTGEITVFSPSLNGLVKSGQSISGESNLSKINFRIIDSISGVIASGELTVVNGKFSGTTSYTTNAKEGRIDIFGTKTDGTEFSNIEIPVRFQ